MEKGLHHDSILQTESGQALDRNKPTMHPQSPPPVKRVVRSGHFRFLQHE